MYTYKRHSIRYTHGDAGFLSYARGATARLRNVLSKSVSMRMQICGLA